MGQHAGRATSDHDQPRPRLDASQRQESRGLRVGIAGNLVGAMSGIAMYLHSNSDALLLDGLYTAVLAGSGLVALQVSRAALAPRSRAYPFGASGQEPLYTVFQSLVMIGMVGYAAVTASGKVITSLSGGAVAVVQTGGLNWYFSAMVLLNLLLWWQYRLSWHRCGRLSAMLEASARSSLFDAGVSAGTGLALLGAPRLLGTPLAGLAPIADALIVLVLSALFLPGPLRELRQAVAESAGMSVEAVLLERCRASLAERFRRERCTLVELAMIRLGRTHTVVAYVDPELPLSGAAFDRLRQQLEGWMQELVPGPALCEVIATMAHPYGSGATGDVSEPG
ncbi:MAG: cation transporter [Vulcanococcus sp.]